MFIFYQKQKLNYKNKTRINQTNLNIFLSSSSRIQSDRIVG